MRKSSEEIVQEISERNMRARAATIRRIATAEGMLKMADEIAELIAAHGEGYFPDVLRTWVKVTRETAEQDLEL